MTTTWRQLDGRYLDRVVNAQWQAGNAAGNGYKPDWDGFATEVPTFTTSSGIEVYEDGEELIGVGYDGVHAPESAWAVDIDLTEEEKADA